MTGDPANTPAPEVHISIFGRVGSVLDSFFFRLVGFAIFVGGAGAEYLEVRTPPTHALHIVIWAVLGLIGLAMVFGKRFIDVVSGLFGILLPVLVKLKLAKGDDT